MATTMAATMAATMTAHMTASMAAYMAFEDSAIRFGRLFHRFPVTTTHQQTPMVQQITQNTTHGCWAWQFPTTTTHLQARFWIDASRNMHILAG